MYNVLSKLFWKYSYLSTNASLLEDVNDKTTFKKPTGIISWICLSIILLLCLIFAGQYTPRWDGMLRPRHLLQFQPPGGSVNNRRRQETQAEAWRTRRDDGRRADSKLSHCHKNLYYNYNFKVMWTWGIIEKETTLHGSKLPQNVLVHVILW